MIRVVGANPALDHIATWSPIRLGEVNRASDVSLVPGGKGFNVARALARLGVSPLAYGFLGGHIGQTLREMVVADGVIDRHTDIAAETRVCFIAVEPEPNRTTVLNEPGPPVTIEETGRFLETLREDCRPDDVLVLSGSLPDSVDPSVAGDVIGIGSEAGARTICDIHGASLVEAVLQRPWMVKCNAFELRDLVGGDEPDDPVAAMLAIRERGVDVVVVTMGPDGALLADADGVVRARVPRVDVVNVTGCGDVFLAGLAAALEGGGTLREALALGAACGTAAATHLPPELPPRFDAGEWTTRITLEVMEPRV